VPPFVSLRGMSRGTEPASSASRTGPSRRAARLQNLRLATASRWTASITGAPCSIGFDGIAPRSGHQRQPGRLDSFTQRAFDMIASGGVRTALDLPREPANVRERYRGVGAVPDALAVWLRRRRLRDAVYRRWDTHGQNFQTLRRQLPRSTAASPT